jgi:ankyrin repeat protein
MEKNRCIAKLKMLLGAAFVLLITEQGSSMDATHAVIPAHEVDPAVMYTQVINLERFIARGDEWEVRFTLNETNEYALEIDVNYGCGRLLRAAAVNEQVNIIEILLAHGADINTRSACSGNTVLHDAIEKENRDMIRFLIKQCGADVNVRNSNRLTQIFECCRYHRSDMVRFLIDECLPDWAAKVRDKEVLKFLLKYGYINVNDAFGYFPLFQAAEAGNLKAVKFLIANGADTDAVDEISENNVLHYAVESGNKKLVKFLVGGYVEINKANINDLTPLAWAVRRSGDPGIIRILKKHGGRE